MAGRTGTGGPVLGTSAAPPGLTATLCATARSHRNPPAAAARVRCICRLFANCNFTALRPCALDRWLGVQGEGGLCAVGKGRRSSPPPAARQFQLAVDLRGRVEVVVVAVAVFSH